MGLDFSHGKARFSYSGLNRLRRMLEGYAMHLRDIIEAADRIEDNELKIKTQENIEALKPLFEHSDCVGSFSVEELSKLCPAIEAFSLELELDLNNIKSFQESMREALDKNEPLEFF